MKCTKFRERAQGGASVVNCLELRAQQTQACRRAIYNLGAFRNTLILSSTGHALSTLPRELPVEYKTVLAIGRYTSHCSASLTSKLEGTLFVVNSSPERKKHRRRGKNALVSGVYPYVKKNDEYPTLQSLCTFSLKKKSEYGVIECGTWCPSLMT